MVDDGGERPLRGGFDRVLLVKVVARQQHLLWHQLLVVGQLLRVEVLDLPLLHRQLVLKRLLVSLVEHSSFLACPLVCVSLFCVRVLACVVVRVHVHARVPFCLHAFTSLVACVLACAFLFVC